MFLVHILSCDFLFLLWTIEIANFTTQWTFPVVSGKASSHFLFLSVILWNLNFENALLKHWTDNIEWCCMRIEWHFWEKNLEDSWNCIKTLVRNILLETSA